MIPEALDVNVPLLTMVIPPVPLAVQAAPLVMLLPVKLMPEELLVVIAPLKLDSPLPAT